MYCLASSTERLWCIVLLCARLVHCLMPSVFDVLSGLQHRASLMYCSIVCTPRPLSKAERLWCIVLLCARLIHCLMSSVFDVLFYCVHASSTLHNTVEMWNFPNSEWYWPITANYDISHKSSWHCTTRFGIAQCGIPPPPRHRDIAPLGLTLHNSVWSLTSL